MTETELAHAALLDPEHTAIVRAAIDREERDVWLAVEGAPCPNCWTTVKPKCPCAKGYVAPFPWADLAKPCETCGATGFRKITHVGVNGKYQGQPCPDCRDGLPLVELRATCAECRGTGHIPTDLTCGRFVHHEACAESGTVRLAVATVEVLPVYGSATGSWQVTAHVGTLNRPPTPDRDYIVHLTLEDQ